MVFPFGGHLANFAADTLEKVKMNGLPTVPVSVVDMTKNAWANLVPAVMDASTSSAGSSSDPKEQLLSCPDPYVMFRGFQIEEPALIPTCILAAIIGLTGFFRIRKTTTTGHFSYSISFLLFGIMMSDAMFVHCFLYQPNFIGLFVEWIDVTLTSCVALSFGFNGLVDLGLLKESSCGTKIAMIVTYVLTGLAWLVSIRTNSTEGFMLLYVGVIAISCGIYTVAEFVSLIVRKGTGFMWLALGGAFGGFGLYSIVSPTFNLTLCATLGANLGGEFLWFLCSDLSMWALMNYYLERTESDKRAQIIASMASAPTKVPPTLTTSTKVPPQLI